MKIIIDSITELLELTALIQRGVTTPYTPPPSYPIPTDLPHSGDDDGSLSDLDLLTIPEEHTFNDPDYVEYAQYFDPETNEDDSATPVDLPDIAPPEAPIAQESAPRKRGRRKSTSVDTDASPIIVETHSLPTDEGTTDGDDSQTTETDDADAVSDGAASDTADTGGDAIEPTGGDDADSAEQPSEDQGTAATASPSAQAPVASVGSLDLVAYVESQHVAALDTSDSHMDVITTGRDFITKHGHDAYNALKEVVAPLDGVQHGKALPQFTPAERRLFLACMKHYPAS